MLWIAFKLYFYWVLWQHIEHQLDAEGCCELLSNCIFTGFFDNFLLWWNAHHFVVNCFQIVFLLGSLTTCWPLWSNLQELWIAFKLYFYWVLWQPRFLAALSRSGCELLSNCIFTGFFDNKFVPTCFEHGVVNCFQIVFLLGSLTTITQKFRTEKGLWIAFKLYFYWVLWQLGAQITFTANSCELLSNCIFTGFFDNWFIKHIVSITVVNCFQIVFLLGSLTT